MRETILLAPGANSTELIRSLAQFGRNTLDFRIMNAAELARYSLQLCGRSVTDPFLPRRDEAAVLYSFVKNIEYFSAASFADAKSLSAALYSVRSLICEDERAALEACLNDGEFPEKNHAILEVYDEYIADLKTMPATDTIGLVRIAYAQAAPFDADFIALKEFPLSPLEQCFFDRISSGHGRIVSLAELFERQNGPLHINRYTEAYGASNEVEQVIGTIFKNDIPADTCTVAVTNPSQYAQLFYDMSLQRGIPMTFGCGVPILNSSPAQLLQALFHWKNEGFCGVDALKKVIFSEAFDRKKLLALFHAKETIGRKQLTEIVKTAGSLRLSYDGGRNEKVIREYRAVLDPAGGEAAILSDAGILSGELAKGCSYLIREYSVIRGGLAGRVDRSAVKVVCDTLDFFMHFSAQDLDEIIPEILNQTVCSENSREGCLYITGIDGALSSQRKNLFVMGLSASIFPGSPSENYLILDNDYLRFPCAGKAPTSVSRIRDRKQRLNDLLGTATALNAVINLSYSGFDLSELKMQNPSSALFEIFRKENGPASSMQQFEATLTHVGFFSENISSADAIGSAVSAGEKILFHPPVSAAAPDLVLPDRAFSPTAIETFFSCPFMFYLEKILGIEPPEEDDPFTVIAAKDLGSLAHALMESIAGRRVGKTGFLRMAEEKFDRYLRGRPPLHPDAAEKEKRDFLRMMENAYDSDPGNEVIAAEKGRTVLHPSGVKLYGIPDRVEKTPRGEVIIADFKTARRVTHKKDDIDTCLQAVLYAYMLEQDGIRASRCEYRYLRYGRTVTCEYSDDIRKKLDDKLKDFKAALDAADFAPRGKCDVYCQFGGICQYNKPVREEAEES